MKAFKTAIKIFLGLLILLGGWAAMHYEHLKRFPAILPAFYAKQMCSCLYVLKRTEEFCHIYARQDPFQITASEHDKVKKSVRVTGLGRVDSASFVSEKYGCILD